MNLIGPELIRDLVALIQRADAAKLTGEASIALLFRHLSASRLVTIAQIAPSRIASPRSPPPPSPPSRTASTRSRSRPSRTSAATRTSSARGSSTPDAQARFGAVLERGVQTREAELNLAGLLGSI